MSLGHGTFIHATPAGRTPARVAAGVPTGGQFAAQARAESSVSLPGLDGTGPDDVFSNGFDTTGLSDNEIMGLQDGDLVLADAEECRGCNGTGEYYAKTCRDCRGRGTSSPRAVRRDTREPLPVHTEPEQNLLAPMDDTEFADYLDRALGPGAFRLDPLDVHVVRNELRARRAVEIPGMDGFDERNARYAKATHTVFANYGDLGEPQDAVEALGYVENSRFRTSLNSEHDPATEATLRIAETDVEAAEAVMKRLTDARSDARGYDYYRRENDPIDQVVLRFAASPDPDVRTLAAQHASPDTPALDVLARDADVAVRVAVAKRANDIHNRRRVPLAHVSRFSLDLDHYERHLVKDGAVQRDKYGRATVEMLESLCTDPDTDVRREMAQAKMFPSVKAAKALATDVDPMVRHLLVTSLASKTFVHPDVLEILSRDPEPGIRENLAGSGIALPEKVAARLGTQAGAVPANVPTEFAVVDGQIVRRPAGTPPRVARRRSR